MKHGCKLLFAAAVIAALAATLAFGQKPANNNAPKYNVATEVTLKGVVQDVQEFQCPVSGGLGAHLLVKAQDKTILVHLARSKFLKEYEFSFAKGDEVEVLGSKVKMGEEEVILAREITRGQNTFKFRDKKGNPLW